MLTLILLYIYLTFVPEFTALTSAKTAWHMDMLLVLDQHALLSPEVCLHRIESITFVLCAGLVVTGPKMRLAVNFLCL